MYIITKCTDGDKAIIIVNRCCLISTMFSTMTMPWGKNYLLLNDKCIINHKKWAALFSCKSVCSYTSIGNFYHCSIFCSFTGFRYTWCGGNSAICTSGWMEQFPARYLTFSVLMWTRICQIIKLIILYITDSNKYSQQETTSSFFSHHGYF